MQLKTINGLFALERIKFGPESLMGDSEGDIMKRK